MLPMFLFRRYWSATGQRLHTCHECGKVRKPKGQRSCQWLLCYDSFQCQGYHCPLHVLLWMYVVSMRQSLFLRLINVLVMQFKIDVLLIIQILLNEQTSIRSDKHKYLLLFILKNYCYAFSFFLSLILVVNNVVVLKFNQ